MGWRIKCTARNLVCLLTAFKFKAAPVNLWLSHDQAAIRTTMHQEQVQQLIQWQFVSTAVGVPATWIFNFEHFIVFRFGRVNNSTVESTRYLAEKITACIWNRNQGQEDHMRAIARRYVKSKPDTIKYWLVKTGKLNHALKLLCKL